MDGFGVLLSLMRGCADPAPAISSPSILWGHRRGPGWNRSSMSRRFLDMGYPAHQAGMQGGQLAESRASPWLPMDQLDRHTQASLSGSRNSCRGQQLRGSCDYQPLWYRADTTIGHGRFFAIRLPSLIMLRNLGARFELLNDLPAGWCKISNTYKSFSTL